MKFYVCETCGKIITMIKSTSVPTMCCGKKMEEIIPGTIEASVEKHLPVASVNDNIVEVSVGAVEHPMLDAHYIEWICVETNLGSQIKYLSPNSEPKAVFALADGETATAVYAYCNLHGLWKSEI